MIILDDQLFLRVLQGDDPFPLELRRDRRYSLRTTYAYQFRAQHAASKAAPEGVLSTLVHTATAEDVDVLRRRIRRPVRPANPAASADECEFRRMRAPDPVTPNRYGRCLTRTCSS